MRPFLMLACAAALAGGPAWPAPRREAGVPRREAGVEVLQAWSRPAAAGMSGVGYMTLVNHGAAPATLLAVETPAARKAVIHLTTIANGVASMTSMEAGVAVPAGGTLRFAPGGHHLMLLGLARTIKAGDRVPATLVFAGGRRMKVEFEVRLAPPAP